MAEYFIIYDIPEKCEGKRTFYYQVSEQEKSGSLERIQDSVLRSPSEKVARDVADLCENLDGTSVRVIRGEELKLEEEEPVNKS